MEFEPPVLVVLPAHKDSADN